MVNSDWSISAVMASASGSDHELTARCVLSRFTSGRRRASNEAFAWRHESVGDHYRKLGTNSQRMESPTTGRPRELDLVQRPSNGEQPSQWTPGMARGHVERRRAAMRSYRKVQSDSSTKMWPTLPMEDDFDRANCLVVQASASDTNAPSLILLATLPWGLCNFKSRLKHHKCRHRKLQQPCFGA